MGQDLSTTLGFNSNPDTNPSIISPQKHRLKVSLLPGVHKSRWASRSSTPVLGRVAVQGGFDSHALPLFFVIRLQNNFQAVFSSADLSRVELMVDVL